MTDGVSHNKAEGPTVMEETKGANVEKEAKTEEAVKEAKTEGAGEANVEKEAKAKAAKEAKTKRWKDREEKAGEPCESLGDYECIWDKMVFKGRAGEQEEQKFIELLTKGKVGEYFSDQIKNNGTVPILFLNGLDMMIGVLMGLIPFLAPVRPFVTIAIRSIIGFIEFNGGSVVPDIKTWTCDFKKLFKGEIGDIKKFINDIIHKDKCCGNEYTPASRDVGKILDNVINRMGTDNERVLDDKEKKEVLIKLREAIGIIRKEGEVVVGVDAVTPVGDLPGGGGRKSRKSKSRKSKSRKRKSRKRKSRKRKSRKRKSRKRKSRKRKSRKRRKYKTV
jgi:hypothetical protein